MLLSSPAQSPCVLDEGIAKLMKISWQTSEVNSQGEASSKTSLRAEIPFSMYNTLMSYVYAHSHKVCLALLNLILTKQFEKLKQLTIQRNDRTT